MIPSASQESVAADKLREIQTDLAKAEADEAETKSQVESSRNNPAGSHTPGPGRSRHFGITGPGWLELRRQLSDLSVTLTPANYKIQQLLAQIADVEQQSAHQRANIIRRLGSAER